MTAAGNPTEPEDSQRKFGLSQKCPEIVPDSVHFERRITLSTTNTGTAPGRAKRRAKTAHINVRVTAAERGEILSRARLAGMAPSAYMREAALLAGEKPVRVADADQLRQIHVDLKRIGNNLNQTTRALNKYGTDESSLQMVAGATARVSDAAGALAALLAKAMG